MSDRLNAFPRTVDGQPGWDAALGLLGPKTDFTNRTIYNVAVGAVSLHQSLLNGSIFRNCSFKDTDLSRCDLEGCRFENVRFSRVSFDTADIRSSLFSNCEFVNCSMKDTYTNDSRFIRCRLLECDISSSVFTENYLDDSLFYRNSLDRTTCTLCRFIAVNFVDVMLGNCTFLLHIMRDCRFQSVAINLDALGLLYGLSESDVANLTFVFLGDEVDMPDRSGLFERLKAEYSRREWKLALRFSQVSFPQGSLYSALRSLFEEISNQIVSGSIVKKDELLYCRNLIDELDLAGSLPPLSIIDLVERGGKLIQLSRAQNDQGTAESLTVLVNSQIPKLDRIYSEVEELARPIASANDNTVVFAYVRFREEPTVELVQFMQQLSGSHTRASKHLTSLVRVNTGSVIYVLETTLYAVFLLSCVLYLVEGTLVQLTRIKERTKALIRRNSPETYVASALTQRQQLPDHIIGSIRHLMKFIAGHEFSEDPELSGISGKNLEEIKFSSEDASST